MDLSRQETIELLTNMLNDLDSVDTKKLENTLRAALIYLKDDPTARLEGATNDIFRLYRRDNDIDKAYRNAARYIVNAVGGIELHD